MRLEADHGLQDILTRVSLFDEWPRFLKRLDFVCHFNKISFNSITPLVTVPFVSHNAVYRLMD